MDEKTIGPKITTLIHGAILKQITKREILLSLQRHGNCCATGNCGSATDQTWKDGAKKQKGRGSDCL
jgi:hypothetical protein